MKRRAMEEMLISVSGYPLMLDATRIECTMPTVEYNTALGKYTE